MSEAPGSLEREARLWLESRLGKRPEVHRLPGDVSTRRYLRVEVESGESAILAWYPEDQRSSLERFLVTTRLLTEAEVAVPTIHDVDAAGGWMLLEDVGEHTLFDLRDRGWSFLTPWLHEAARACSRIGALDIASTEPLLGPLDEQALAAELEMTWTEFLEPSGLDRRRGLGRALDEALGEILRRLGEAPRVACHRDFMARNLVPQEPGWSLVALDHQDLRLGPAGYDLASLLNDSLFPEPRLVDELLETATPQARHGYDPCVVQRTLKIVGTFSRFARCGSPRYLELVPASLDRCLETLPRIEGLDGASLARELRSHWQIGQVSPRTQGRL